MAASDAIPVPRKNADFRLYFAIRDSSGDLVTSWTGQDSEVSKDGGSFADCTNEATEIGTSGCGYIDLTATEMNADSVVYKLTVTNSNAKSVVVALYPETAGDYRIDTAQIAAIEADTQDIQSRLPAALVSGRIDASVGAMAANTLTASALATDAVSEIQSGLATAANLAIVAGYVDTEIPALITAVADVPTVAEFEARTILATNYATATELAKVIKTGEQFTATDGTGSKNVTFTKV